MIDEQAHPGILDVLRVQAVPEAEPPERSLLERHKVLFASALGGALCAGAGVVTGGLVFSHRRNARLRTA